MASPAPAPSAGQATASPATPPPAPTKAIPPPGFKFVKVRKPDGSIVTVKRKLSPEELAAQEAKLGDPAKPGAKDVTTPTTADAQSPTTTTTPTAKSTEPVATVTSVDPDLERALQEQTLHYRERRLSRMKNAFIRGAAVVIGTAIPTVDIGHWHDGDEEIHGGDDSDFSDNDDDGRDDHDGHDDHDDHEEKGAHQQSDPSTQVHVGAAATATAALLTAKAKPEDGPIAPNRAVAAANANPKDPKEKVTYAVNVKELDKLEDAQTEVDRPLQRHWANISFYALACLAIILPLLFMILGIFIILMNKKRVDSNWHKMSQPIKIATSAWPIVFAAVVAQVLKTYATWRVERGIKLVRLEQLVGSNSFASAVKQPFLIRRIDCMTLLVFLVWCLSPIGSSALQRVYKEVNHEEYKDNATVSYLDTTGYNRMLSRQARESGLWDNGDDDTDLSLMSYYFTSSFVPPAVSEDRQSQQASYVDQDRYANLLVEDAHGGAWDPEASLRTWYTSKFGVPFSMPHLTPPKSYKEDSVTNFGPGGPSSDDVQVERIYSDSTFFTANVSTFNLTCKDWTVEGNSRDDSRFATNYGETWGFGMGMPFTTNYTNQTNYITFTSRNRQTANESVSTNSSWSTIECTYSRITFSLDVACSRDIIKGHAYTNVPQCTAYPTDPTQFTVDPFDTYTNNTLADFSTLLVASVAQSGAVGTGITPVERFVVGKLLDDPYNRTGDPNIINLGKTVTPAVFARNFGYLFNSFVMLGYCPGCVDAAPDRDVLPERVKLYKNDRLFWYVVAGKVYRINVAWVSVYMVCCALLLVAGTLGAWLESRTVAPDVLGYASNVARNNRYLHLPKTSSQMTGAERLRRTGNTEVMMQDVKANADVGKIALGLKHEQAQKLRPGRVYR